MGSAVADMDRMDMALGLELVAEPEMELEPELEYC